MSKPKRPSNMVNSYRTFFVSSSTAGKRPLFTAERMARLFLEVIYHYREFLPYQLHEFTLMPDHFHLLLTVPPSITIEQAMQRIKGGYSYRAGNELHFPGQIWERGFTDHRVAGMSDYENHRQYILQNAVRRGLVTEPAAYPYCSAHPAFRTDAAPEHLQGLKPVVFCADQRHD